MKRITYETPYDDVLRLLLKIRSDLEQGALGNLEQLNIGNARGYIESANSNLPEDTAEGGIVWWVLE